MLTNCIMYSERCSISAELQSFIPASLCYYSVVAKAQCNALRQYLIQMSICLTSYPCPLCSPLQRLQRLHSEKHFQKRLGHFEQDPQHSESVVWNH